MIGEVSSDDLCEPFASFSNWLVHSLSQRLLDLPELCHHTVPARLPSQLKDAPPGFGADEHKAEELEGLGLAEPAQLAVPRRKTAAICRCSGNISASLAISGITGRRKLATSPSVQSQGSPSQRATTAGSSF